MNVQKKQTRFRDDLRRLLLIYALLPLFCALLVLFAVMGGLFISNMTRASRRSLHPAATRL